MPFGRRLELPHPYWLAHPHWVREAEDEGRGPWAPAALTELPPDLRADVEAEIREIAESFGWSRAPRLWKRGA